MASADSEAPTPTIGRKLAKPPRHDTRVVNSIDVGVSHSRQQTGQFVSRDRRIESG
jgi:hypothetical protein